MLYLNSMRHMCAFLCPTLCDSMDCSLTGSLSMGLSQQKYWNGLPFSTPGYFPDPGIEPTSPGSPALASGSIYHWATWEAFEAVEAATLVVKNKNILELQAYVIKLFKKCDLKIEIVQITRQANRAQNANYLIWTPWQRRWGVT